MAHKIDGFSQPKFTEDGDTAVTLYAASGEEIHMVIDEWIASELALKIVEDRLRRSLTDINRNLKEA